MKFIINGTEYDVVRGLQKATLHDLYTLKVTQGIGMKTLAASMEEMNKAESPLDILEDADQLKSFMSIIWLARRNAGEKISFEEATSDFGLDDLQAVAEEESPDAPKAPTDSVPDASPAESSTSTT